MLKIGVSTVKWEFSRIKYRIYEPIGPERLLWGATRTSSLPNFTFFLAQEKLSWEGEILIAKINRFEDLCRSKFEAPMETRNLPFFCLQTSYPVFSETSLQQEEIQPNYFSRVSMLPDQIFEKITTLITNVYNEKFPQNSVSFF